MRTDDHQNVLSRIQMGVADTDMAKSDAVESFLADPSFRIERWEQRVRVLSTHNVGCTHGRAASEIRTQCFDTEILINDVLTDFRILPSFEINKGRPVRTVEGQNATKTQLLKHGKRVGVISWLQFIRDNLFSSA